MWMPEETVQSVRYAEATVRMPEEGRMSVLLKDKRYNVYRISFIRFTQIVIKQHHSSQGFMFLNSAIPVKLW